MTDLEKLDMLIAGVPIEELPFTCETCPIADLCIEFHNTGKCISLQSVDFTISELATIRKAKLLKHHTDMCECVST